MNNFNTLITNPEDCEFGDERLFPKQIVYPITKAELDLLRCRYFDANILLNAIVDEEDDSPCIRFRMESDDVVNASREKRWPGYIARANAARSEEGILEDIEDM